MPLVTKEPCSVCGSLACAVQSPEVCRHTGKTRQEHASGPMLLVFEPDGEEDDGTGITSAVETPPRDKQVRRGKPKGRRGK